MENVQAQEAIDKLSLPVLENFWDIIFPADNLMKSM